MSKFLDKVRTQLVVTLASLLATPIIAHADATNMFLMEGTCGNVLIAGKSNNTCAGILANSIFDNDEVLFAFTLGKENISMLKFYGDGKNQVSKNADEKIQPITTVEYVRQVDGSGKSTRKGYVAAGQCRFQNPYLGVPAIVDCSAETEDGVMRATFITNGETPIGE